MSRIIILDPTGYKYTITARDMNAVQAHNFICEAFLEHNKNFKIVMIEEPVTRFILNEDVWYANNNVKYAATIVKIKSTSKITIELSNCMRLKVPESSLSKM